MFEQHSEFDIFICKHLSFTLCHSCQRAQTLLTFGKVYSKRSFSSEQTTTGDLWYFLLVGRSCALLLTLSGFIPGHLNQHTHAHTHTLSLAHKHTFTHNLSCILSARGGRLWDTYLQLFIRSIVHFTFSVSSVFLSEWILSFVHRKRQFPPELSFNWR